MGCCASKTRRVAPYEASASPQTGNVHKLTHSETFAHINRKEDAIGTRYEEEVAILVTDMSGFTRLTKKMGIIHFASLILKMRSICRPIYEAYGALSIMTEADNFLVLFPSPEAALAAALEAKHEINAYNATISDQDFRPIIGGYGIGMGRDTVQAKNHMLFGEARDIAFRLGEDIAENGEICIDHLVHMRVKSMKKFAGLHFERRLDEEDDDRRAHFVVEGNVPATERLASRAIAEATARREADESEWSTFMTRMIQRLEDSVQRASLDHAIRMQFMQEFCILVVGLDFSEDTEKYGVMHSLGKMIKISKLIAPILQSTKGHAIEDTIFRFSNTTDCLLAALKIKSSFLHINNTQPEKEQIHMKGFGIHRGEMLFCPNSDVHWGDPLNTSSKLGEDLAEDGQLYITSEVYKSIRNHRAFQHLEFEKKELEVSHVTIACYAVTYPETGNQEWSPDHVPWERSSANDDDSAETSGIRFFAGEKAVLVSDMSGFTRLTRKKGIVHYASLIFMMRSLLTPMFEHLGAICIETEADNFFVVFPDPAKALQAACMIYALLNFYNAKKDDEDFRVIVGGIGIAYGAHLLQDEVTGKLYGPPVDRAFRLGEDVAEAGEILIDSALADIVMDDQRFRSNRFENRQFDTSDGPAPAGLANYFNCTGPLADDDAVYPYKGKVIVPKKPPKKCSDADFFKAMIIRRLELAKEREAIDAELTARFNQVATVVMVGADYAQITEQRGVRGCVALKQKVYSMNRAIVLSHNGVMVEEGLWLFRTPIDAVAAVIEARSQLKAHNEANPDEAFPLKGYGVHMGNLLVVKDTNVHWGDPVNTASKLGEDVASRGELFITREVYEGVHNEVGFTDLVYQACTHTISKVELQCYQVSEAVKMRPRSKASLAPGPSR